MYQRPVKFDVVFEPDGPGAPKSSAGGWWYIETVHSDGHRERLHGRFTPGYRHFCQEGAEFEVRELQAAYDASSR